jgi:hypothetical protein
VEFEDAGERGDEQHRPRDTAQIAPEVGTKRGESGRDSYERHDLAEQLPAVALERYAAEGASVAGRADRGHDVTPGRSL